MQRVRRRLPERDYFCNAGSDRCNWDGPMYSGDDAYRAFLRKLQRPSRDPRSPSRNVRKPKREALTGWYKNG
jgi:hypothetical protein